MPLPLTTIGFDADDTLWQNEHFYKLTEGKFLDLLGGHGDRAAHFVSNSMSQGACLIDGDGVIEMPCLES